MPKPALLYTTFDLVPAPKGAAVHVEQFARGLAGEFGALQLASVSLGDRLHERSCWPGVEQVEIPAVGPDLIARVINFRRLFAAWLGDRRYEVVHFRSPFEGLAFAAAKGERCRYLVFEVNGLPSIELKYRYPLVAEDSVLVDKLVWQENACLAAADLIVVTCQVTRRFLIDRRQVDDGKIVVIPNGVALETFRAAPPVAIEGNEPIRLLYFGTLSAWQGVELALKAVALAAQETPVQLVAIGPASQSRVQALYELAQQLGIGQSVIILPAQSQEELVRQAHAARAIIAPLSANDRNLDQGCCPLKVLEGMACGRPVIASEIAAVKEIAGEDCVIYAKSNSAHSWKECILQLRTTSFADTAARARRRIEERYTWSHARHALADAYRMRLSGAPAHSDAVLI